MKKRSPGHDLASRWAPAYTGCTESASGSGGVLKRSDVHRSGHRRGGAVTDSRRDLLGQLRANVADCPHALHRGLHVAVGDDVAGVVVIYVHLEKTRVGHETDEDEDASHGKLLDSAVLLVAHDVHLAVALDLLHLRVEDELDLRIRLRPIDQDRLRPQLAPAVNDVDLRRVAGEKFTLFHGRVPTADHRQLLALEERAIADRAVAHAATPELLLTGHLQVARQTARGHDQRRGAQLLAGLQAHHPGLALDVDLLDRLELADFDAELAGVLAHLGGELRAEDGLKARVVLDQLR